jgi:hypothetical protein
MVLRVYRNIVKCHTEIPWKNIFRFNFKALGFERIRGLFLYEKPCRFQKPTRFNHENS